MEIRTARTGRETGTWKVEELQRLVDRGDVLPSDLVWTHGFLEWKPLSEAWNEIGIRLPAEVVPPIPGSHPPPLPQAPIPHQSRATGAATGADFGDLKFKGRAKQGRRTSLPAKSVIAVVLIGAGWLGVTYGVPWLAQRQNPRASSAATSSGGRPSDGAIASTLQGVSRNGLTINRMQVPSSAVVVSWIRPSAVQRVERGDGLDYYLVHANVGGVFKLSGSQIAESITEAGQQQAETSDIRDMSRVVMGAVFASARAENALRDVQVGTTFEYPLKALMRRVDSTWEVVEASAGVPTMKAPPPRTDVPRLVGSVAPSDLSADIDSPMGGPREETLDEISRPRDVAESERTMAEHDAQQQVPADIAESSEPRDREIIVERGVAKYPAEAQRLGIQGTVFVLVEVDASGKPSGVTVEKSSGNALLDAAAVETAKSWRFAPAMRDGKPFASRTRIPIDFKLQ